jgi:hypothetical protein
VCRVIVRELLSHYDNDPAYNNRFDWSGANRDDIALISQPRDPGICELTSERRFALSHYKFTARQSFKAKHALD